MLQKFLWCFEIRRVYFPYSSWCCNFKTFFFILIKKNYDVTFEKNKYACKKEYLPRKFLVTHYPQVHTLFSTNFFLLQDSVLYTNMNMVLRLQPVKVANILQTDALIRKSRHIIVRASINVRWLFILLSCRVLLIEQNAILFLWETKITQQPHSCVHTPTELFYTCLFTDIFILIFYYFVCLSSWNIASVFPVLKISAELAMNLNEKKMYW